jgi:hypothetical protein
VDPDAVGTSVLRVARCIAEAHGASSR